MTKYLPYIIVSLLLLNILQGFFSTPKGISESEMAYRLKIQQLSDEKVAIIKENNRLELKLNFYKDELIKKNNGVDSLDINELNTMFTNRYK